MPIELIYHKKSIKKDGLEGNLQSPFKIAIKTIANKMNVCIACPYINIGTLKDIIKDTKSWLLITDVEAWLKTANSDNAKEIQTFLNEHNAFIRHSQGLHAKLILNQEVGLLGSANFTINGINNNTELSVLLDEKTVINELLEWFNQLWKHSTPVINFAEDIKIYLDDLLEYEKKDVIPKPQPKLGSKTPIDYAEEIKDQHENNSLIVNSVLDSNVPTSDSPVSVMKDKIQNKIQKSTLQILSLSSNNIILRGQRETIYWNSGDVNLTIDKGQANGSIKSSQVLLMIKPISLIVSKNEDNSINRAYKMPKEIEELNIIRQDLSNRLTVHLNQKKFLHMNVEGLLIDTEKYAIKEIEEKQLKEVEVDLYGLYLIHDLPECTFGQLKIPENIIAVKGIYDTRKKVKNAWRFFFYISN